MKRLLLLLLVVFVIGCQNQNKKSVEEKIFVELGGEKQYVEMTGSSDQLPVLLFLHGGPGWPQNPQLRYFNSDLTKEVILVSWDQAGCGRSFMKNPNPKNLSAESLVIDAHELTQWLQNKFNKRKIFLVGFSYGSVIGLKLAEKYPEDYYAYIGVDQIIDMQKSWDVSMQWLKEQAQIKKDSATLSQLQLINNKDTSVCGTVLDCFMSKYQLLLKYEGVVYDSEISKEIEKAETMSDDYKGYNWFDAFNYTAARMKGEPFITDISHIKDLEIPVYFMAGRHDWNLPGIVAENHLSKMIAPKKKFIWFEKSGHEIPAEESEKFNQTIINIVKEKSR